ncbi:type II secretion system F family protein [bacterium]|nr:type II secretion system F family protein [bacterium]
MEAIILIFGKKFIYIIGIAYFVLCFTHARNIFQWLENQTIGTQTFVLEKFDFLFMKVKPDHVTYVLIGLAFIPPVIALGVCGIFGRWTLGVFLAMFFFFIGIKVPRPIMNYLVKRKIKAYQGQMVDGLTLLANGLRAGLSVPQSIGMVTAELKPPLTDEFNYMLQQNRIGTPLEECFDSLVARIPTEDNEMFVSSVNILRETGGNLAEVFDTIVQVIRERVRLQQKVDTYVAQGMIQGLTIFCMPYVITILYAASDPESLKPLYTTTMGWILVVVAIALDLLGGFIMLKIVKIKI